MSKQATNNSTRYFIVDSAEAKGKESGRSFSRLARTTLASLSRNLIELDGDERRSFGAWFLRSIKPSRNPQKKQNHIFEDVRDGDEIIFTAADERALENLFSLLPLGKLKRPLKATARIRLAKSLQNAGEDTRIFFRKLQSGSPFQCVFIYVDNNDVAKAIEKHTGISVYSLSSASHSSNSKNVLVEHLLAPEAALLVPSLTVKEFGPVVAIISALWGRVGSSTIFDAQTRFFIESGYIVARIFVDHHPKSEDVRRKHVKMLVEEDLQKIKPHFHIVGERNASPEFSARIERLDEFAGASPLLRTVMILGEPVFSDLKLLEWLRSVSVLTVVNHLMHIALAENLFSAPIIIETHDVFSDLLSSHGIPYFVPVGEDSESKRAAEEKLICGRVAACVNLSPEDHSVISSYTKKSAFIRPYIARSSANSRSWREIVKANYLRGKIRTIENFDLVLWGTQHPGNIDGIHRFLEKIRPLHPRLEEATILIVGRVLKGLSPWVHNQQNVYCTGAVDRIEDFLCRGTVAVIPDQSSTGMSIKMMDASALGCAFVSTMQGLRTLDIRGTTVKPHTDDNSFAQEIIELLNSAEARASRIQDGKKIYEMNFSESAYNASWDNLIRDVFNK